MPRKMLSSTASTHTVKRNFFRNELTPDSLAIVPPRRDEHFYFDDGDVVFDVQGTLFRPHRFLLSRDSSAFRDMFRLPGSQTSDGCEGQSDDNPVILTDEADEFRALLWVLYALPHQLQVNVMSDNVVTPDLQTLSYAAKITNKYVFASLEAWIFSTIRQLLPIFPFGPQSSSLFTHLLDVADLCHQPDIFNDVASIWLNLILHSAISPIPAIHIAERYTNLNHFQGVAYYIQLQNVERAMTRTKMSIDQLPNCEGMSQEQLDKLLAGYKSLTLFSERTIQTPTHFPWQEKLCDQRQHTQCIRLWRQKWHAAAQSFEVAGVGSPAQILKRLFFLERVLRRDDQLGDSSFFPCREGALLSLQSLVQQVANGMSNHFKDNVSDADTKTYSRSGESLRHMNP